MPVRLTLGPTHLKSAATKGRARVQIKVRIETVVTLCGAPALARLVPVVQLLVTPGHTGVARWIITPVSHERITLSCEVAQGFARGFFGWLLSTAAERDRSSDACPRSESPVILTPKWY